MTDEGRQPLATDPDASIRETLRATIEDAQAKLIANLAQLRSAANADTRLIAQGDAELGQLAALQSQLQTASPTALAMIGALIAASAANAATLAQRVNDAVTTAQSEVASQQLAVADKAARDAVTSFENDFYERKIFDDFLDFKSDEDKKAYREREEERKRAIDEAKAKNTPQGTLEANQLAIDQLKDAGAHGADKSPDYERTMHGLTDTRDQLVAAIGTPAQAATVHADRREAAADTDEVKKAVATVDPAVLAVFAASVAPAAHDGDGHGLAANGLKPSDPAAQLG